MLHLSAFVWRISLHVHAVPVEATEGVRSETEGRLGAAVQGLGIEPGLLEEVSVFLTPSHLSGL